MPLLAGQDVPTIDLVVHQGSTLRATFNLKQIDGITAFDLTNYRAACQMRPTYTTGTRTTIDANIASDETTGRIDLFLDPRQTADLKAPSTQFYDVELHHRANSDQIVKVVKGKITIKPSVTILTDTSGSSSSSQSSSSSIITKSSSSSIVTRSSSSSPGL